LGAARNEGNPVVNSTASSSVSSPSAVLSSQEFKEQVASEASKED
jgi:hypothetical protein